MTGFIVGMFVGAVLGVFALGLLIASRDDDSLYRPKN